jgi:D-alanine--poly(phosphoribitol) ligase subunit 1
VVAQLIHEAVARQARLRPEAVAVEDRGERLTYQTLDAAAQAWAARLADLGVGGGTLVPLLLPRSTRLIVALLAVLRCGAGYAALDPRWPRERVDGVLSQLGSRMLVTDSAKSFENVRVWQPPTSPAADGRGGGSAAYAGTADAPASVFFTSGTSGMPKGVVSPHRATMRLFAPDGPLTFGPGTVMLQSAPAAWDAFSFELWGVLTSGGTCVVAPEDHLLPDTLRRLVASSGVNTAWMTSSLFNLFVEVDPDSFRGLQRLYIGGERLSAVHVRRFLAQYPEIRLFNGYGPVETCVFATVHPIVPQDCEADDGIPIGRPVPGTRVHLLDEHDRECPPGVSGELCVSGEGVAHGYLGDPVLTMARFGDVVVGGLRRRIYRTGDRGFQDTDGTFHFIGRTDRQVKIRGYRIEPEEVEACAAGLPEVTRCVAVPVPGQLGTYDRLALFYTGPPGQPEDATGLRRSLAQHLPSYAVPDLVSRVDKLPLTPNGKIDHAALLAALAS